MIRKPVKGSAEAWFRFNDSVKNVSELQELVELIELFINENYEGIILLDAEGVIQYTNRKHGEYFETPPRSVLHKHISEMASPEVAQGFMNVIRTGEPELLCILEDGGREFIANRWPIRKNGKVIGAAGIVLFDIKEVDVINKKMTRLEAQLAYYKNALKAICSARYSFEDIIGESVAIKQAREEAKKVAQKDAHVLLIGESGTGKELFAHAIHNQSQRRLGSFVGVNCSAIPQELLESELFGYEPGSFTGANKGGKKGKFELAHNGTIFLDEIGDMPLQMQSKVLRVLQEKEIDRIGGTQPFRADFRVIAATNTDLGELVERGAFRKDLYYRLNVLKINIPPLRKRIKDIEILTERILKQKGQELGLGKISIEPAALRVLERYRYPGNVRELINIVEKAINHLDTDNPHGTALTITEEDVTAVLSIESPLRQSLQKLSQLKGIKQEQEAQLIRETLRAAAGNITRCAEMMGIHRTCLHRKIRQYNLEYEVQSARRSN
ncbi:MAG TPA: sigma 54-interacting transcriptional regulator [Thermodesulfobacteriota bacterium]|nr:sigma 54-interacting transcriptional regulator [Thermodesulfobacteriota bacterium]